MEDETRDWARVRKRGSNAWLHDSARISRHSQGAVDLSYLSEASVVNAPSYISPTPTEAMDSVINDRRSIQWPCYAVNTSQNRLHSYTKRDLWHEVKLEKNLEQPNIDLFRKNVHAIINHGNLKQKASVWFLSLKVLEATFCEGVKTKHPLKTLSV